MQSVLKNSFIQLYSIFSSYFINHNIKVLTLFKRGVMAFYFSIYYANCGVISIGGSSSIFMMRTSKDSMKEMIVLSFSLLEVAKVMAVSI